MSKAVSLICLLFVAALALISSGVSPSSALPGVEASSPNIRASTFEARSELAPAETRWMRLRWIFVGAAIAAILLVGLRQLRLLADLGLPTITKPVNSEVSHDENSRFHTHPWREAPSVYTGGK